MLRSWRAPRAVIRARLSNGPREDRALMVLMIACLLIFVAQWPALARMAHLDPEVPLQVRIGGALFGWLFLAPLLLYGLAAAVWGLMRLAGSAVEGHAVRFALFWSLLSASPLWLLHGLMRGAAGAGNATMLAGFVVLGLTVALAVTLLREAALERPDTSA